jgi:hypothetical protein
MLMSGCVIAVTVVFISLVARRSLRHAFAAGAEDMRKANQLQNADDMEELSCPPTPVRVSIGSVAGASPLIANNEIEDDAPLLQDTNEAVSSRATVCEQGFSPRERMALYGTVAVVVSV